MRHLFDNITVFRLGASPMALNGVGEDATADATTPGFSITFNGDVSATAPNDQVPPRLRTKITVRARAGAPPHGP